MLPAMRSGLVGEVGESHDNQEMLDTVAALMRVFMRDAIDVAARYTSASRRRVVRGVDMRHALMYCARLFFQRDDAEIQALVAREREAMEAESTDSEESTDDGEGEEGEEEPSDEEGEEGEDEEEQSDADVDAPVDEADRRLVVKVDRIVASWPHWQPTDPVHLIIKRAIDNTPA